MNPPALAFWVHQPHPFLIQFSEQFGIRYYGLAYLLGFVAALWLLVRYHRAGRSTMDGGAVGDLMVYLVIGVIVGGRLGSFLLYHPEELFHPPWAIFMVWKGGMASHGGFLGVVVAIGLFTRKRRETYLQVADLIVTAAPLGLLFGRIANFLNGELWGKLATVPWAVIFKETGGGNFPRHPSQLYEAGLEGLVLFAYMQLRFWGSSVTQRQPGRLAGEFLVAYAGLRAICEVFREPDADLILGLSRGTFYSIFLVIGGLALVAFAPRKKSEGKA